jgi:pyridinium-3,5-biscarboxylic acid mononucleotide sulfurtransferase
MGIFSRPFLNRASVFPDLLIIGGKVSKLEKLKEILRGMESALVAYSGGVDSTFLLKIVKEVLGTRVLAVTAVSESYTAGELKLARSMARKMKVRHELMRAHELSNPDFASNPPDRCYHCKKELFSRLAKMAASKGLSQVLDASNADDLKDYRPGRKAVEESGARSPLVEAGLTKNEIRRLSRNLGLPTWNMPSMACLASRIPYHSPITPEKLRRIAAAEKVLRGAGLKSCRVRDHGDIARIEVPLKDMTKACQPATARKITVRLKKLSYSYVALDLQGYRMGSLNEEIGRAHV